MCAMAVINQAEEFDEITEAERELRVHLAACYRLVAYYEMDDKTSTHISARVPGADDQFLLNPAGRLFSQVRASDLIKIDLSGTIRQDTPHTVIRAGYVIHSALMGARPDIGCAIHTHTTAGMAVSAMECGFLPLNQKSMRFYNHTAYHDYEGYATELDERESLVADLGDKDFMILRNHGLIACGPTVWSTFRWMYSFETACRVQVAAMAGGTKLTLPSPEVCAHAAEQANRPRNHDEPEQEWLSLMEMLDGIDPSYRD
jgi:ribulose-5-phosphate 4-epimerase/fuculose-1-phosphate aldolase